MKRLSKLTQKLSELVKNKNNIKRTDPQIKRTDPTIKRNDPNIKSSTDPQFQWKLTEVLEASVKIPIRKTKNRKTEKSKN